MLTSPVYEQDSDLAEHRTLMSDLLQRAWDAGGYHLRLEALDMAERSGRNLDPATTEAVIDVLEGLERAHPLLQSSVVEALVACGRAVTDLTAEDIAEQIEVVLTEPVDTTHQKMAVGIVSSMFDVPELVGPVYETVEALPAPKRTLLMMMAASQPDWMFRSWALRQVVDNPEGADPPLRSTRLELLRTGAALVPRGGSHPQDEINVHLVAVRGLARLTGRPPGNPPPATPRETAWTLVDRLIAGLEGADVDPAEMWAELLANHPAAAVNVFWEVSWAGIGEHQHSTRHQLEAAYPVQWRRLLEWALQCRDDLADPGRYHRTLDRDRFIVAGLGRVGDGRSARLLDAFRTDADLAPHVVAALKEIHGRTARPLA